MKRLAVLTLGAAILWSLLPSAPLLAQRLKGKTTTPPAKAAPPTGAARAEKAVPFKVGETLTYDVTWSAFLSAGTAVFAVEEKKPSYNSTAYYIVAEGRPTPLVARLYPAYYKLDTLLDSSTLLPQRGSAYSEEGSRHELRTTVFDHAGKKAQFERRTTTTVKTEFPISPVVQDALSALYVLRASPLKAGDRMTMLVSNDGANFQLQVAAAGPEPVKTVLGEVSAWRLTPTITDDKGQQIGQSLSVWISDDARRLPMKIQADLAVGSFVLSLREAR